MTGQRHRLREQDLTWRSADRSVVILDHRRWVYLQLNGSAARLWSVLAQSATLEELAETLVEAYGIPSSRAQDDAGSFLRDLARLDLLSIDT